MSCAVGTVLNLLLRCRSIFIWKDFIGIWKIVTEMCDLGCHLCTLQFWVKCSGESDIVYI